MMSIYQPTNNPWAPRLQVLTDEQIKQLHAASLEILERVGVQVVAPEALELLHGAGASVGHKNVVRIPPHLVEKAIETAPSRIVLYTRDGEPFVFLEVRRCYYGTMADCWDGYLDPGTGERRPSTLEDTAAMARLTDYLPNLVFLHECGFAEGLDPQLADRAVFRQIVMNTQKVIGVGANDYGALVDKLDMAAIVAGGEKALREKPFIFHLSENISPLVHPLHALEGLLLCAERGIPVAYWPIPGAGSTAPASKAAVVAQANAETLSGLVIHQLKQPGSPYIYGGIPGMLDMKSMVISYGAPEMFLMVAAMTDLSHYYEIPMWGTAGCTDAKRIDGQAVMEGGMSLMQAELTGANLVHDVGYLDHATVISPEYIVLLDAILDWTHHFTAGVPVTRETLALDVIAKVGPGGAFLTEDHTFDNFRAFWYSQLFYRSQLQDNPPELSQKVREETLNILRTHQVPPLPDDIVRELDRYLKKFGGLPASKRG
jgi:trimethylamine--corrinoid protein Co-methyltransferase